MWPSGRTGHYVSQQEMQEDTDDEAFHGADAPVDILLFTSLDSYVLSVQSTELGSTNCSSPESPPYPRIMYYNVPPGSNTTESDDNSENEQNNVADHMDEESDHILEDDESLTTSDVISVQSRTMTTNCLGPERPPYPRLMYYNSPPGSSTPEIDIDGPQNDHTDEESNHALEDNSLVGASSTEESMSETDLSPILFRANSRVTIRRRCVPPTDTLDRRRLHAGHRMADATRLNSQVANRVVKYARYIRNMHESELGCLNCGLLPLCPITGQCGHTRCTDCVVDTISCPCGYDAPVNLYVNILIRDLIGKTTSETKCPRSSRIAPVPATVKLNIEDINDVTSADNTTVKIQPLSGAGDSCRGHIRHAAVSAQGADSANIRGPKRIPMSPRARYNHALDLLRLGQHREAVPYLAIAAASGQPDLRRARVLLAQAIRVLSNNRDPRRLVTQLTRAVRRLSSTSWITSADMECILCRDTFTNPVTTPCGHMFCRTCLERTLDYGKRCPLCLRDLIGFTLSQTGNTSFMQAALKSINAIVTPLPLEPDLIPIFVCTVAYPSVPCPLFIFDPRYWLMIRRVLESGTRSFGMVACDRSQDYVEYGTILEVRDCVHLEDGRSILSTIGVSRFKVIERGVRDGCDVARILPITDVIPRDFDEVWEMKVMARRIMFKALLWLSRLNAEVLADIEAAFGVLQPRDFFEVPWWESTDGPSWLWWLVAVLPLRSEIKVLILSTNCLIKRMMAVARTLEAVVDQDRPNPPSQYRLQNPLPAEAPQTMEQDGT